MSAPPSQPRTRSRRHALSRPRASRYSSFMRSPLRITSADNARLKSVLHLRRQRDRRGSGLFIAEGSREISRALEAGLKIQELFYSPQMAGLDAAGLAKRFPRLAQHPISLYELTPSLLQRIAYNENPEGLLLSLIHI